MGRLFPPPVTSPRDDDDALSISRCLGVCVLPCKACRGWHVFEEADRTGDKRDAQREKERKIYAIERETKTAKNTAQETYCKEG